MRAGILMTASPGGTPGVWPGAGASATSLSSASSASQLWTMMSMGPGSTQTVGLWSLPVSGSTP